MIETERLILRQWREEDRAPFAALNADAEVMRHFPGTLSREESDAAVDRQIAFIAEHGYGNFAVERRKDGAFLGHVGIKPTDADLPFDGAHEIGWRLARLAWGAGYASEGARAVLAYGFERLRLPEIVSFTATTNAPSEAVMKRIGMVREAHRDFDHPFVLEGHLLRRHIVYVAKSQP